QRQGTPWLRLAYGSAAALMILVTIVAAAKGGWLALAAGLCLLVALAPPAQRLPLLASLAVVFLPALAAALLYAPAMASSRVPVQVGALALMAGAVGALDLARSRLATGEAAGRRTATALALGSLVILAAVTWTLSGLDHAQDKLPTSVAAQRVEELTDPGGQSFVTRLAFSRAAFRIGMEHPLLGTGAGGWNALYHQYLDMPYFTTEVHNHFLQVWVETGIIGMAAFLAMWVVLLFLFMSVYRAPADASAKLQMAGITSAALVLGMHAAIDIDLSLPAVAIILWSLLALAAVRWRLVSRGGTGSIQVGAMLGAAGLAAVALVLATGFLVSYGFEKSAVTDAHQGNLESARVKLVKATEFNPWDGFAYASLARVLTTEYQALEQSGSSQSKVFRQAAQQASRRVEEVAPYDLKLIDAMQEIYSGLNDFRGALRMLDMGVRANPLDARRYSAAANGYLDIAVQVAEKEGEKAATEYVGNAANLLQKYAAVLARVQAEYPDYAEDLMPSPGIHLARGRLLFLRGDYAAAQKELARATRAKEAEVVATAKAWQAAALVRGKEIAVEEARSRLDGQDAGHREEFERLLAVKVAVPERSVW
ncbi:MAG: O-antigen ligase family protein, partial [Syntrophomonadaceae bacterium]|nr:O-antigen ligase family protein [Syntrophomonadaceae bacterium]